jgi:hypothetical protein
MNALYLPVIMAQNESSNGTETHPQVNACITFPKHAPALSVNIHTRTHERQHDIAHLSHCHLEGKKRLDKLADC